MDMVSCDDYMGLINALKMLEKRKMVTVETLNSTKIEERVRQIKEGSDPLYSAKLKLLRD
jgi:hypothetical protein